MVHLHGFEFELLGYAWPVARACAYVIRLTMALMLFFVCARSLTFLRCAPSGPRKPPALLSPSSAMQCPSATLPRPRLGAHRRATPLRHVIPVDNAISLHMLLGYVFFAAALGHSLCHFVGHAVMVRVQLRPR